MIRFSVFAFCGWLLVGFVQAQSTEVEAVLQNIETNNLELKAMQEELEANRLELQSGNNLPDPTLGAYYLPFGDHAGGDYTEIQVAQSIEFPSVYRNRKTLINRKYEQFESQFQVRRQEILTQARGLCFELIYQQKQLEVERSRLENSRVIFEHTNQLYEKEMVGILSLNKARIAWMQEQFKVQSLEQQRSGLLILLQKLNGDESIEFESSDYSLPLEIENIEALWQEKLQNDPKLQLISNQELLAQARLDLTQSRSLPNLTAGFNRQGVSGSYYSGLYAGITIPLWSNRNKVKAARSNLEFRKIYVTSKIQEMYGYFERSLNEYALVLSKFQEYQTVLTDLNSDELLLKAYQLGEISFLEYYMELQFYRQAYDVLLKVEYELYEKQNQLLKHQL